ncbi:hydantoinase B/oxoprolinase family protein [Thermogymnomonas acidicola]|uniref:hydantoinase B/oxoprolinase family protein n=1 Tax=Thermogymnomonas acidicola TaxID=399579 RepID=UPI0009465B6B|nr:hydantoinase B/oxoprolinase family protein [Thermogymnomonas acidicola]
MVALSCGIPLFTGVFDLMVRAVVKRIRMEEGDVVMTNDPYLTGTHLNDMGFVMPVFDDGLVAFCVCKGGHLNDIGGNSVGSWSLITGRSTRRASRYHL